MLSREHIDLTIADNLVAIRAETCLEPSAANGRGGSSRGQVFRAFTVAVPIAEELIVAEYENGTLTLLLPKNRQ